MKYIWRVIKKFVTAIYAFLCYITMLPIMVIGWTIYGFFRGFVVWSWNVTEIGMSGVGWEINIPKTFGETDGKEKQNEKAYSNS